MSAFVTETLPQDLTVLIFSQSPVLSDLFADQLQQHGLEVTQKSSDSASLEQFLDSGLSSTWYKVFWIDDVEHLSIDQAKKMVKIFQETKGLSYVVMHQPFSYRGEKRFEQVGQNLIDVSLFFEQRSPYTSLLTYQDLLSNELFSLNYQQIIHFLHQSKFPFTSDQIGFLNEKEVVESLVSLSFDPRGGKRRVVVSKRPLLTKTIMKTIQSEFRRRFKGEEVLLHPDLKSEWSGGFKDFPIPGSATLEEVVSELIVEAKFHYQPEKTVEDYSSTDIPRPHVPKARPLDEKKVSASKTTTQAPVSVPPPAPTSNHDEEMEKEPTEKNKKDVRKPLKIVEKRAETPRVNVLDTLPLSQLVPKSMANYHLTPQVSEPSALVNTLGIQESAIQLNVASPIITLPNRGPILIPEQQMPDIRRSKIILQQFSTSLERHVNSAVAAEAAAPQVNPQITARVHHERQQEQEKIKELEKDEEHQKRLLEKKIATLFSGTLKPQRTRADRHQERTTTPIQILFGQETRVGKWYRAQKGIFWFFCAVFGTAIFLVALFFFSVTSLQKNLMKMVQEFEQGGGVDSKSTANLIFSQNLLDKQLSFYSSVMGTSIFADSYSQLDVAKKLSTLSIALNEIQTRHVHAIRQVLGAESGDPVSTLTPSLGQTDTVYKQLSLLEGELKDTSSSIFFQTQFTPDQQKDFIDTISEIRREVLVGQQLTEVIPNILNKERTKTIAIVLQDSQELRATGGFVQSIATVTLTEGKVSNVKILKPDEVSSAISGEIQPPEEVQQYLGEKQWHLRDANWNPNFEITAKQIQFFLEKGTSTTVDGVIGINTNSLAKVIGVLGSVSLKDFDNESITEKNFAEREFFYAKTGLLSTEPTAQKPDFLASIFQATLEKIKTMDESQTKQLVSVLSDQLKQAEITASFQDLATETTLGTLGWTGSVITPPCPTQLVQEQCLVSRIYQVDSNVGVNKVNYSIKKKVEHSSQIKSDMIIHQRTITYENSSNSNSWPGGVYKNYIRWYLPDNAKLRTVTVNNVAVEPALIKQYQDKNSQVVGVFIEVLPETTSKVVLEYQEESIGKQASYAFFDQKQPGTGATPTKITMFYDPQYVPIVIAPDAQISGEKIEFSFWGGEHSFAGVKFR
ncbi:MAG: DUF4012 domain-containing protein [Patescibacteria group bacterium]